MSTASIRTDPIRYLALQYLVLAFSQLRVRDEALRCLEDLLAYLAAEPEANAPTGGTCGELAMAYLHDLQVSGRHEEHDFRWLQGDRQLQHILERYRLRLESVAPADQPVARSRRRYQVAARRAGLNDPGSAVY